MPDYMASGTVYEAEEEGGRRGVSNVGVCPPKSPLGMKEPCFPGAG